ncbi:MAG: methylenetetrahydrofolate reductase [NAD(P)H] [Pseudomonadota bacterium]
MLRSDTSKLTSIDPSIASLFQPPGGDIEVSFEFFPPKTDQMEQNLWRAIQRLKNYGPRFVSVTYGAGGTTRERTHRTVSRILEETQLKPAAHLTCVGASKSDVDQVVEDYWAAGVRHIVALRGDPAQDDDVFTPHPQGYTSSVDLISSIRKTHEFEISVGCYPEKHPEARDMDADIDYLKRKIDAGATQAISQFFFQADMFFRFLDKARAAGITVPILPGILPVTNFKQLKRFAAGCGASVPEWMARLFEGLDEEPETRNLVAAALAAEQCRRLYAGGVRDFHFYTLNRADLTYGLCHILGKRAQVAETRASAA